MVEPPRRRSKLIGSHPAERHDDDPAEQPQPPEVAAPRTPEPERLPPAAADEDSEPHRLDRSPTPRGRRRERGVAPLVTRNPRRLRATNVSDDDMVSFNCKMSRGLRRRVRILAANNEVDIQDVVAAALEDYLAARTGGIEPR
jgi:hypothetical protein